MILYCNFEELAALHAAVARSLDRQAVVHGAVAATEPIADLESLLPRLVGDLTIQSLADQASVHRAVAFVIDELRARLDQVVVEQHPAAEDAVLAYFDYAHVLTVLERLDRMGREMAAMVELLTGESAASETSQRFVFPDD